MSRPPEPVFEILTIGREILDGRVVDTNAVAIAEALGPLGITPRFGQRVDDEISRVVLAFEVAASRATHVLVTGGLGPTSDDLTAEAFARFMGAKLELNPQALRQVETFFMRIERPMQDVQTKQAFLPPGANVLQNDEGSAPGFWLSYRGVQWFFAPGVPREMKAILATGILPLLPRNRNLKAASWATHFTSEGGLQAELSEIESTLPLGFEVTYRTRFPENHIGILATCDTAEQSRAFENARERIGAVLGARAFETNPEGQSLRSLEEVVVEKLRAAGAVVVSCESCTGGRVAARITSVSGSSAVFWGGAVTYDNEAKIVMAGVPRALIEAHGAVSKEVAAAMAEGLLERARSKADSSTREIFAVATTGIAGPSGGTSEKPVGLCFLALASNRRATQVEELRGRAAYGRERNQLLFSQKALELVRLALTEADLG